MLPPAPPTKPNPVKSATPTARATAPAVTGVPPSATEFPTSDVDQSTRDLLNPIKSDATNSQHIKTIGPSGESLDEVQREVSRIEASYENERSKRENDVELRRRMFPALAMPNDPNALVS